jgi:hypothetical protein
MFPVMARWRRDGRRRQRLVEGVAKQLMGQFFQCMQSRFAAPQRKFVGLT